MYLENLNLVNIIFVFIILFKKNVGTIAQTIYRFSKICPIVH